MDEETIKFSKGEFVDVFGNDISVGISQKNGDLLVPLKDVKTIGFKIFKKRDFHKLIITHSEFTQEFDLYLLNHAKDYMLEHRIQFEPAEVIASIEKCKEILLGRNQNQSRQLNFLKSHVVKHDLGSIQLVNNNSQSAPSPLTVENLHRHESVINNPTETSFSDQTSNGFSENGVYNQKSVSSRGKRNSPQYDNRNGSRYRYPKPPKLPQVSFDKEVHKVVVTCVKEPEASSAWVRDTETIDTMIEIHNKVCQYEPEQDLVMKSSLQLETLYLAEDGDDWFRCKVVKFNPLAVFFVDYGNVYAAAKLKTIPEQVAHYECQAVLIKSVQKYEINEDDEFTIKPLTKLPSGEVVVEILNETEVRQPSPMPEVYMHPPLPLANLSHNQKVIIASEIDNIFYLRTIECYQKLQEITNGIAALKKEPIVNHNVKMKQLVLCKDEEEYRRGIILGMQGSNYDVSLIDYGRITSVPLESLAVINEWLATQPQTCMKSPVLKGFDRKVLSRQAKEFIQMQIEKKVKYKVILSKTNEFDLDSGNFLLSFKLMEAMNDFSGKPSDKPSNKPSDKLTIKNMTYFKPKLGLGDYLCGTFRNITDSIFMPIVEFQKNELIVQETLEDKNPYTPSLGELCYGKYSDEWYRCVVAGIRVDKFELSLIDFGNLELVTPEDIRKCDKVFMEAPILGLKCRCVGYPNMSNIKELLKKHIEDGEVYKVNFKQCKDEIYEIEIPSVYEAIKKC